MKRISIFTITFLLLIPCVIPAQETEEAATERRITVSEFRSKMKAGWIGQMAGVGWGAPTEFQFQGKIIPEDKVPEWKPEMVNVYAQDDLYVEMTFMRSMEEYGFDLSINQAGIDFANSKYLLWVANRVGRSNLRNGIAPPNSGHPKYNEAADAIDYQIEADFSGLIAPGLPNTAIQIGEKFGRLMNYGDGLYGGQFVGAMYAEAFFEDDPAKIVDVGLKSIPAGSQYAEAVRDVIQWHSENPDDWQATWELINKKYHENQDYRRFTYGGMGGEFNIDAKLNGAYIVMGLLYGNGDPDQTIIISMRCGQDSDCNPSNAAGILFTAMGYENIPERFLSALDNETKFSFTEYTFPGLIDVSEKLARQAVDLAGGSIEMNEQGEETFVIPISEPVPSALEQSWQPGPVSDNTFSDEELSMLEGSAFFKYSLLILLIIAFVLLKENRDLKAIYVLIPLVIIVALTRFVASIFPADLIGTMNFPIMFETLAVSIAVLLLLGERVAQLKWHLLIVVAIITLFVLGFAGISGAEEGRITAHSKMNMTIGFSLIAGWLLAMVFTAYISLKKYSKLKFHLFSIPGYFIFQVIALYVAASMMTGPFAAFGNNIMGLLVGAFIFAILLYLLMLPFLILTSVNSEYEKRFFNWIGQKA